MCKYADVCVYVAYYSISPLLHSHIYSSMSFFFSSVPSPSSLLLHILPIVCNNYFLFFVCALPSEITILKSPHSLLPLILSYSCELLFLPNTHLLLLSPVSVTIRDQIIIIIFCFFFSHLRFYVIYNFNFILYTT